MEVPQALRNTKGYWDGMTTPRLSEQLLNSTDCGHVGRWALGCQDFWQSQEEPKIRIFMWNIPFLSVFHFECMSSSKSGSIFSFLIQSTDLPDCDLLDAQVRKTVDVNFNTHLRPPSYLVLKWSVSMSFHLYKCKCIHTKPGNPVSQHMREILYAARK